MNISNINTNGNAITDSVRDYTTAKGAPMSTHNGPSVALILTVSHVRFRVYGLGVGVSKNGCYPNRFCKCSGTRLQDGDFKAIVRVHLKGDIRP